VAERAVGVLTERAIVVDVYSLASEAVAKKTRDEEREVGDAAKTSAMFGAAALERAGKPQRQRLAVVGLLRRRVDTYVLTEQVGEIEPGEVVGLDALSRERRFGACEESSKEWS